MCHFLAHPLEGARENAYLRQVNFYTHTFSKIFKGVKSGLSLETSMSLKSVALTVLELLAFNDKKFRGSHELDYAPFKKFKGPCPDCP